MKYCFLIIVILYVFSACSSNTNQNAGVTKPAAANSNPVNANTAAVANSNSSAMQSYNGAQNLNPNAFNAANDNRRTVRVEPKTDEVPFGSRAAPDDSVISSGSRGKDFVETRTFKSHAVLAKLEKIMDGNTTKFKVYLKNGKVLDAPAEKMTNYATMAPENILSVVGAMPKPPANPVEKKDQNQ